MFYVINTVVIIIGSIPRICLPCCLQTSITPVYHSAASQSICPTMHCSSSTRSCRPTSRPTSLRFVSSHSGGKEIQEWKWTLLLMLWRWTLYALISTFILFVNSFRFAFWLWGFSLNLRPSFLHSLRYSCQPRISINHQRGLRDTINPATYLPMSVQGEENMKVQPVFAVCLQAELVPASVQDYREKLLHLRKLRQDLVQRSLPQGPAGTFQQVQRGIDIS